jgi:hypothetical protein
MVTDPVQRTVLSLLADEKTMTRTALTQRLADDDDTPAANTQYLEMTLHHSHLPKLADDGYIEYDARLGDIALWETPESVRARLDSE